MNKHCKGCQRHYDAGRRKPTTTLKKFNDWCSHFGKEASKAIGHCLNIGGKVEK